jgi:hypothetical protein
VGGDSGPVKDRYRDSGDEENNISNRRKTERIAANDSAFRRVWCSVEKLNVAQEDCELVFLDGMARSMNWLNCLDGSMSGLKT